MGDPRTLKAKYSGPRHPWQRARLEEENLLGREYGLKTKRELWKITSKVKTFAAQAKKIIATRTAQSELEKKQLLDRLARLGLLPSGASLDDVLALTSRKLLDRRLQSVIDKKGLARTHNQARQYIVHAHVLVADKKVTAPSYIVPIADEPTISFIANSTLANPEHPERTIKAKPKEPRREPRRSREGRR